jgi:hypothetical protein
MKEVGDGSTGRLVQTVRRCRKSYSPSYRLHSSSVRECLARSSKPYFLFNPRRPHRSRSRKFLGQNRRPRRQEMRRFAPSVFASQPIEGVSERYSFLPTCSILNGMREMVGFPYAPKSRPFELKHGAASRNTLSGLLVLSISRPGKRTKFDPRSFL